MDDLPEAVHHVPTRIGSLFSGIGGLELGLEWAGLGPVLWQCELDAFRRSVLARHWPEAVRYDDVRCLDPAALAPVDLVCGGFPCQDVSSAGKRAGLAGARSGLWYEFARIVAGIRPAWVVVENVASGAKLWVDAVCGDLGRLGYATLPVPVAASDCGAWHRRRRVFVVAHARHHDAVVQAESRRRTDAARSPSADAVDQPGARRDGRSKRAGLRHEPGLGRGPDRSRAQDPSWAGGGFAQPDVVRLVHGLPQELGRIYGRAGNNRGSTDGPARRALGDSVVPQCAEVVGHVIRQLTAEALNG